ncbi:MAG: primosomal protein N' [Chloroflexota bacterium]
MPAPPRFAEVAVDAAGIPGGRTFTYHLPPALADLGPGTAVLVEYGRRPAVGVILALGDDPGRETKPVRARIHGERPLLPPLQALLAREIARDQLAPPALVVRAMLPPGMLERAGIVATADPGITVPVAAGPAAELLARVRAAGPGGVAVDALPAEGSRATLLRRLRELESTSALTLAWRIAEPGVGPRRVRRVRITDAGRAVAAAIAAGTPMPGPALGPRQRLLLAELGAPDGPGEGSAARLADAFGASAIAGCVRRGLLALAVVEEERLPLADRADPVRGALPAGATLRPEQAAAIAAVAEAVAARRHTATLLEGPTASGKTAVTAGVVAAALAAGRGAIVLVPEIALAVPLLDRLRHDLGVTPVLLHGALGEGERADAWRRIRDAATPVVVGTRTAILAPVADPGVIVVDEEHDPSYKSDRTPRYQARDTALLLGRLAGAPVVLASATPDIVTLARARAGEIAHRRLPRTGGPAPTVEVVDLRAELAAGNRGLLSAPLVAALAGLDRAAGARAILVMNRRGSASVVLCRDCGYLQVCPECLRPLVFHAAVMGLRCHHCGATAPVARRCPACDSARIRYLGGGTERVEQEVAVRLPGLRVGRLDRDVSERRGAAVRVIDAFTAGELDVLVGTSLVTKGLDIPEVTLVGVVSADVALSLPDERAAERTWQLLVQAVGRAGRGERPGRAIIQTYLPEHPAIVAVASGDPGPFLEAELERRRRFGSPPYGRLVKCTAADADRGRAEATARSFADTLRERAVREGRRVTVLGPVPAYVARRGGRWRFHVVLRGTDPLGLLGGDPGPPWSVDVDPETLL